jgi:hypothetical protein
MFSRGNRLLCPAALALVMAVGCQQKPSTVEGTVTVDGRPMTLSSDARGTIVFQPSGGKGTLATGVLDEVGHFRLATGAVAEVTPGKYQVAISVVELLPATEENAQAGKRITPSRYASAIDSGLQAEVVTGENQFKFDLLSAEPAAPASAPAESVEVAPVPESPALPTPPEASPTPPVESRN